MRQLQAGSNSDWLLSSWQRSKNAGISQKMISENVRLGRTQISERKNQLSRVLSLAENLAVPLFNQVFARSNSKLILTDAEGIILKAWGQKRFDDRFATIALETGVCWQEKLKGTNAIGTALIEGKAISVIGKQHFINKHHFISCSASPVFDHSGKLMAILDITSEQQIHHSDTLLLIQNMVRKIEDELLWDHPGAISRVDLALDKSMIGTDWQGIAITDEVGNVIAHNQIASQLFDEPHMVGKSLQHLLEERKPSLQSKWNTKTPKAAKRSVFSPSSELHSGDITIEQAWQQASKLIDKQVCMLILGETGVGKNEFVKQLHKQSERKLAPLVTVNCGALPKNLIESELFGYAPGAFTGANSKGYEGKIRQAHNGILFLDEIADMPLDAQCRLLHVLQDKEVVPVGSNKRFTIDTQVIAATHKNIEELVAEGSFRQDLFYRLNGLIIRLPSLKERHDKKALIHKIHQKYATEGQTMCRQLLSLLLNYEWPGNIRELDNILKVSSLLAADKEELNLSHLPAHIQSLLSKEGLANSESNGSLRDTVEDKLITTYQANKGNISKTSKMLGISRNTLYRKLKKIGILRQS